MAKTRTSPRRRPRKSRPTLAIAQDALGAVTWVWDLKRDRIRWFGDLSAMLGLPPRAYSGRFRDYLQRVHPEDREAALATFVACLKGRRPEYRAEERVVWPDGTVRWLETYGRGVYGSKGRCMQMMGVVRDATERIAAGRRLHQSEALVSAVFAHSPDSIVVLRVRDGMLLAVNDSWVKWSGHAREAVLGRTAREIGLLPPERIEALRDAVLAGGQVRNQRVTFTRPDGGTRHALLSGVLLDIDGEPCVLWLGRDMTEQRIAEEEVRRLNVSLERRVAERTIELEAATRDLESFTYSVSHDLRAPLRAVSGFAALLRESCGAALPEEGRRLLARVEANAARMNELIAGMVELSKAGLHEMTRRRVDMRALAEDAAREAAEHAPRPVQWRVGELPAVFGDAALLQRVWANLVGNAIKYARHVPEPRVEIGARTLDGVIEYHVRDNGAGFDMQFADRLFGLFQRLHPESRFEGTGVGLALVKRIVRRHGGEVSAEGAPGEGATFRFTLPIRTDRA